MFMLVTQPTDLQAMQTVGVIHALANEIPRGKAIIMLDLEFYENHRPHVRETPFAVAEWREVLETEERQTRREFLRRVGLHDFCLGKKDKCLVTHRGESWQTQDNSQRLIRDGDYVLVKVQKKNPKQTIQEQWSRANGQCERTEDSQYVQRLLRWDQQRHVGSPSGEEDQHLADNVSLLQLWRPTFAKHAHGNLKPPGNGKKSVAFNDQVEMQDTTEIDLAISNRFIQAFCETRQEGELDSWTKEIFQAMRFEEMPKDANMSNNSQTRKKGEVEPLHLLPICREAEELPIDFEQPRTLDLETLLFLPIRDETPRLQIELENLILFDRSPSAGMENDADPLQNFVGHGSTAVCLPNPRLCDRRHVHDRFVECDGLGELVERVTTPGGAKIARELKYSNLLEPKVKDKIVWGNNDMDEYQYLELYTDGSKLWCVEEERHTAGWAVMIVGTDNSGRKKLLGHLAGRVVTDRDDPMCMGAYREDSDTAEMEAMVWAALWALQEPKVTEIGGCKIISDSFTKVMATEGKWKMPETPQGMVLLNLMMALQQRVQVLCEWTRSHMGDLFNELADHCAKCAARFPGEFRPEATEMNIMEFGDALPWLWATMDHHGTYGVKACHDGLYFRKPKPLSNTVFFQRREVQVETKKTMISMKMASFNINTFKSKSGGIQKETILLRHLEDNQISVAGIQETRRRCTKEWQRGEFFGFSSAAAHGQGGIDIIFHKKTPIAWQEKKPIFFEASHCSVIFAEAQMMAVQMKSDHAKLIFVAAHAPHDGTEEDLKETFWAAPQKKLKNLHMPMVLLIDANAKMGESLTPGIGGAFAEPANTNSPYFQELIESLGLWLPSTEIEHIKDAGEEQGTWHHRNGLSRLDYVCLPRSWKEGWCKTTPQDVEFAENYKDHRLVMAEVEVEIEMRTCTRSRNKTPDRQAMNSGQGKAIINWLAQWYVNQRKQEPPLSGDELIANYENYMQEQLVNWFPKRDYAYRPSWITDEAWKALRETKSLRRYARDSKAWERKAILRQIFNSWKNPDAEGPSSKWLKNTHTARAWAQKQVERISAQTKQLLQRDEAEFFKRCIDQYEERCMDTNATDLWKVIKKHLPKMKEKVKSRAMRFTGAHQAFEKHFADNEKAVNMSDQDLQEKLCQMSSHSIEKSFEIPIEIRYIPTLQELERAIRKAKAGKACYGNMYPEWMLAAPRETALAIFPALIDLFVFFQEPACLKGGEYFPLWKQRGTQQDPSNYRAILLSSFIGKALHHLLRQRLVAFFPRVMRGLQIGGLPRQRVQFGAHALSLMRRSAVNRNISHAVVFFDMTSAFYHTSRPLVVENVLEYPFQPDEEDVALLPTFQDSAVAKAGVPEQLKATLQETLTFSWFNVTGNTHEQSNAWVPQRGTRPGDSCADLSFSFVMARVLNGFLEETEAILPLLESPSGEAQRLTPITWVDDVAVLVEDSNAEELIRKIGKVTMAMKKQASSHGLTLNFKQGKTEAMIRFQGHGSAKVHRQFREQGSKLLLEDEAGQELHLLSTTRYGHLGAVQTVSMTNNVEVTTRIAKATQPSEL